MKKDSENNKTKRHNSINDEQESDIGKNIKKGMDRFEEKIRSGEAPAGDATRSEE
jgi:hypothetical protein